MMPSTAWRRRGETSTRRTSSPTRPRASSIERLSPEPESASRAEATTTTSQQPHTPPARLKKDARNNGHTHPLLGLGLGLSHTSLTRDTASDPDHLYLDADGRAHLGAKHQHQPRNQHHSPKHPEPDHSKAGKRSTVRPTSTQYRGPPKRNHARTGSTIDDLASIAIATSPQFNSNPTFPYSTSPHYASTSRPSTSYMNGYSQESFDRPAKRIKSERLYSQDWSTTEERPKSSHTYNLEVRQEDAELLLSLHNGFRFDTPIGPDAATHLDSSDMAKGVAVLGEPFGASSTARAGTSDADDGSVGRPSISQTGVNVDDPMDIDQKPDLYINATHTVKQELDQHQDALSPTDDSSPRPPPIQAATGTVEHEGDSQLQQHDLPKKSRRVPVQTQPVCPICNQMQYNGREGELTIDWIKCEGSCNRWFHIPCAGFSDYEVKKVAKFICKDCEPEYGPTTYARTSTRARAAPDYAALNEGVMKSNEDTTMHHFVPRFKDGSIKYNQDDFARIRPEILDQDFWANMDGMKRPFIVPACWNPRFGRPSPSDAASASLSFGFDDTVEVFSSDGEALPNSTIADAQPAHLQEEVVDLDQDYLDMIMPRDLTVRKVAELYGPEEPVPVIEVKTQETRGKFTLRQWANYYEETGQKPIRNVISLEVSHSRLGRLIRRPKVVRDIDLEPQVWDPTSRASSKSRPIAFYCLMSVGDSYTDFHIDFGGSSVYYHILKGQKTFFFIPPLDKYLKKYEEWNNSPLQNDTWLGDLCDGNVTRVDLRPGDTAFIPAGWIHSVWTPCDSLVIGGNFITRYDLEGQIKVTQIEKATNVAPSFRYPFFQKVMWYTLLKYLEDDPVPESIIRDFQNDPEHRYIRPVQIWEEPEIRTYEEEPEEGEYNARRYTKSELRGLPTLRDYIYRTARIYADLPVDNINKKQIDAVKASVPKGHGDPLQLICLFAVWVAWKLGNVTVPDWVHADSTLQTELDKRDKDKAKKPEVFRVPPERVSARRRNQASPTPHASDRQETPETRESDSSSDTPKLPYPRIACEACRKKRQKCHHHPGSKLEETAQQTLEKTRSYSNVTIDIAKLARASPVVPSVEGSQPSAPTLSTPAPAATSPDESAAEPVMQSDLAQAALARMSSQPPEPTTIIAANGVTPTPSSAKKGRSKACEECRKSKRRCVHDEHGRVDPAKAAEPSKPRGSSSGKRPARISDEHASKKVKIESHDSNDFAVYSSQPDIDSMIDPALMGPIDPMVGTHYQPSNMIITDVNAISTPPHPLSAENSVVQLQATAVPAIDPNLDPALMDPELEQTVSEQQQQQGNGEVLGATHVDDLPTLKPVSIPTPDLDKSYSPITTGSGDGGSKPDGIGETTPSSEHEKLPLRGDSRLENGHSDHQPVKEDAQQEGSSDIKTLQTEALTSYTTNQTSVNGMAKASKVHDAVTTPETSDTVKQEVKASSPADMFTRADTVASSVSETEVDASERLARELQAQEHGLRRRPSVRIS